MLTTHGYPPTVSGVTLVVQRLARALVGRGHRVTVLAGSDTFRAYDSYDRGVHVIRLDSRRNPYWQANPMPIGAAEALQRLVHRERPDAVHAHDALPFLLHLARAHDRLGPPLVATCHYYPSFVASYLADGQLTQDLVENLAWQYTIGLYNRVPNVVFATRTHQDRFKAKGLSTRTHVISNGVDLQRYSPLTPPLDTAERYGLPAGPKLLAVGRLARDKDLEVLVRAVRRLEHPDAALVLVGEGPHREALEETARRSGVDGRIHFMGFVPEDDLPGLYRACDVFVISSNHEVQSLPALQAAAVGLPIVAADRGALPEICRDGENGLLVRSVSSAEWAGKIGAALEPGAHERMAQAGLRLAREHDERLTFDRYESLYDSISVGRKGTAALPRRQPLAVHE